MGRSVRYQVQKWPILVLYSLKGYRLIARYCSVYIATWMMIRAPHLRRGADKPSLFALCPERFRGELEALEANGYFNVIPCPTTLVYLLNALFVQSRHDAAGNYSKSTYYDPPEHNPEFSRQKKRLGQFYGRVLPFVFQNFNAVAVIVPNFTMPHFDLFGHAAQRMGLKYVVMHREGLMAAPGVLETNRNWAKIAGKFQGDHLIVHNSKQMEALVESGYVDRRKISALGCIRMDKLVNRLDIEAPAGERCRKSLVLFSFVPGQGLVGISGPNLPNFPPNKRDGLWQLFTEVHAVVGEIARDYPEVEVVIKAKWGSNWRRAIHEVLRANGLDPAQLPNLKVTHLGNAHDLIFQATVVTSYGSTTMLEAALANKPVVFPFFAELRQDEFKDYVFFSDQLDIFDVAQSRNQYKQKLTQALFAPVVDDPQLREKRRAIFSQFVSDTSGEALRRYEAKLIELVNEPSR